MHADVRRESLAGRRLSFYQLESLVGEGGMGQVYLGQDSRLGRRVAVKVLPSEFSSDSRRRERFLREARTASALNHPNIVTIHDIGTDSGIDFIVMEYVDGVPLSRRIGSGRIPVKTALRIAADISGALAAAHSAGIVHRDVKPSNVVLTSDGRAKVLDFGLAKIDPPRSADAETVTDVRTQEGVVLGTIGYMAPEQAMALEADARSDIFSFGAVLYEMLTGTPAFERGSAASTMSAILRDDPPPLAGTVPDLPPEADRLIARCLRKEPERRFQSMADVKLELEELCREIDSGTVLRAPARRISRSWLAAGLSLALLVAGAAWFLLREAPLPPMRITPLTSLPGAERQPNLSPDGNTVAFSWGGPDGTQGGIYLLQVGSTEPVRRTVSPEGDHAPRWSPDGQRILFTRGRLWNWKFYVMPALAGPEKQVGESVSPLSDASWTPDGKSILFTGREGPQGGRNCIWVQSLETGERRRLTLAPVGINGDYAPAINQAATTLSFARMTSLNSFDLYRVAVGPGYVPKEEPRRIVEQISGLKGAAGTGHGTIVSCTHQGTAGVWRLRKNTAAMEPVWIPVDAVAGITIAPRANRMVVEREMHDWNIWRLDLHAEAPPAPLIASTRRDASACFLTDGRIAFLSDRTGTSEVWVADPDGSRAVQLTSGTPADKTFVGCFPDPERPLFVSAAERGVRRVYLVDIGSGRSRVMPESKDGNYPPRVQRTATYLSRFTGAWNLFRIQTDGGLQQLTKEGGVIPTESPDGKYLYYGKRPDMGPGLSNGPNALWRMPLTGTEREAEEVIPSILSVTTVAIAQNGVYYFTPRQRAGFTLCFRDNQSGQTRTLWTTSKLPGPPLSLSRDGRYLLFSQLDSEGSDLVLVENFR